ncbi:hypothetical protein FGRMN_6249 [Fusarium graminum]|nr:hypothetical protein FGRMN_6249 [Fusarium graminum]
MLPDSAGDSRAAVVQSIAKQFEIDNHKIREIVDHFSHQIKRGLQAKHSYQIPSFVTQIPSGQEKGLFLAVDLGGTNCRVCAVDLHGDSTFDVLQKKHVVPSNIRVNSSHQPLFHFIAVKIQEFLQEYAPNKNLGSSITERTFNLGFTFSFTCEQTSLSRGTLVHWDKGWDIPSTLGQDPCALLQVAIDEIGLPVQVCVLANDAVGTLLARAYTSPRKDSALASIILGTGTNAAYVEKISNISRLGDTGSPEKDDVMVINTEWGCWDDELVVLPQTQFDKLVAETSSDPGCGLFEKMVSGMYLGELLRLSLLQLAKGNALEMSFEEDGPIHESMGIESAFLTKITELGQNDSISALSYMTESLATSNPTTDDLHIVQSLATAIVQRSARLVGAGLAAILIQSGRLESIDMIQKKVSRENVHEIDQKPSREPTSFFSFLTGLMRRICGCIRPQESSAISIYDSPYISKEILEHQTSTSDAIDIAVDGSLFEFHAEFESFMRSALRDVPEIGKINETRLMIELTRDGSVRNSEETANWSFGFGDSKIRSVVEIWVGEGFNFGKSFKIVLQRAGPGGRVPVTITSDGYHDYDDVLFLPPGSWRVDESDDDDQSEVKSRKKTGRLEPIFGRRRPLAIDFERLRNWIQGCEEQHGICQYDQNPIDIQHFRLIDIEKKCIVQVGGSERPAFATLSYVGGKRQFLRLVKANVDELETAGCLGTLDLPSTIRDAITVCEKLHIGHLWIDSLCIIQDDEAVMLEVVDKMDSIYGESILTIVAATGSDAFSGIPGVRPRTRFLEQQELEIRGVQFIDSVDAHQFRMQTKFEEPQWISGTPWARRAWTFQEALVSRRALFFTSEQVYWSCRAGLLSEDTTDYLNLKGGYDCNGNRMDSEFWPSDYEDIALTFSTRRLTYEADIGRAYLGTQNYLGSKWGGHKFSWGLPHGAFGAFLVWEWPFESERRLRQGTHAVRQHDGGIVKVPFPSWSWMSWTEGGRLISFYGDEPNAHCPLFFVFNSASQLTPIPYGESTCCDVAPLPRLLADGGDKRRIRVTEDVLPTELHSTPSIRHIALAFYTEVATIKYDPSAGFDDVPDDLQMRSHEYPFSVKLGQKFYRILKQDQTDDKKDGLINIDLVAVFSGQMTKPRKFRDEYRLYCWPVLKKGGWLLTGCICLIGAGTEGELQAESICCAENNGDYVENPSYSRICYCLHSQGPLSLISSHKPVIPSIADIMVNVISKTGSMAQAFLLLSTLLSGSGITRADNPIVQDIYTADPAPVVYDGRVYLFTGHDNDGSTTYNMTDWRLFSSADMVNWQHHGSPMSLKTFSWVRDSAWAGQVIARNGKFYFYAPMRNAKTGGMSIGVGVSNTITGPYADALGKPLVENNEIDPTVFIDSDGQAYMYWGNPGLYYVKLNSDMLSYSGGINKVSLTTAGFGSRPNNAQRPTNFEEGPWIYKRGSLYYMIYAANCCSEDIRYSTGPTATGPWTYRGVIMAHEGRSFTNHPGIIDFEGKSYFFYHNGALDGGSGYTRSVAVESFTYGSDGLIPTIKMTQQGPAQIKSLDPYVRQEAETMAWSKGIETETCSEGGFSVGYIDNGDYIKVKGVAFGNTGAKSFSARVAADSSGGKIELRLGSETGTLVGTCTVSSTGGWQKWTTVECPVSGATGTKDLFLRFTGSSSGYLFNFNWWQFK